MTETDGSSGPRFAFNPAWRTGYNPNFLGPTIPSPVVLPHIRLVTTKKGETTLNYTRFSLELNAERRLTQWVAWNIDGDELLKNHDIERTGFRRDPRIKSDDQWSKEMYVGDLLEQGHVARRADLLWGNVEISRQANYDSSYYPNIVPHTRSFHRSEKVQDWGNLENALFKIAMTGIRISVFGGPILQEADPPHPQGGPGQIPTDHWKVLSYADDNGLFARSFVLTQDLTLARGVLDPFDLYRVPLQEVGRRCHIDFPEILVNADSASKSQAKATSRVFEPYRIESLADIEWF